MNDKITDYKISVPLGKLSTSPEGKPVWMELPSPAPSVTMELEYDGRKYKGILYLVEDEQVLQE